MRDKESCVITVPSTGKNLPSAVSTPQTQQSEIKNNVTNRDRLNITEGILSTIVGLCMLDLAIKEELHPVCKVAFPFFAMLLTSFCIEWGRGELKNFNPEKDEPSKLVQLAGELFVIGLSAYEAMRK